MENKVAFIVGGTGDIGKATAKELAARGAKVFIGARREQIGEQIAQEIRDTGGEAFFIKIDVTDEESIKKAIRTIVNQYGRLDWAVNNAAVNLELSGLADSDNSSFLNAMNTNVFGVYLSMKNEIQQMLKNGGGSIVNVSSVAGLKAFPAYSAYVASKHAVQGLTKAAALDYASQGIRINSIAPGQTQTKAAVEHQGGANTVDYIPMKRAAEPKEVAKGIAWLLSDEASYTTGTTLMVDGGVTV
ncbi:SDR family NAD(P)-dependent oxidoreductase [Paenibacillus sp. Aloe-11]|uniref:SDR family NAD(P)-dependent oxidoreductase n=1 Tax=Paenibacillus sp. Aloe-11 TaxID=1050222 RepID=UPI00024EF908|nr:glucose 1-dehydrogenase [Paenibacillus sp. Aloe-11]EHS55453.1 2,5-dichloro-2,5-cyclohexadiene-1,4-diol dehydrogenase [Paenibacillus sp. Aloe-11]